MANPPLQLSSFIGRGTEIEQVTRLLSANRLVTLTGPGGVGKTRLALAVAESVADRFPDGVHFVGLAHVVDPALVASTIVMSLGLREGGAASPLEMLLDDLREQRALLLLDNFEQLTEAAPMVTTILMACPSLKVLTTSRVRLHVSGEREFPVPPLQLPEPQRVAAGLGVGPQTDAVMLFVERAMSVSPTFTLTPANISDVTEICRRLDGLPLAIELASARIKLLTPQGLLDRLDRGLILLSSHVRGVPLRQQTVQATIAWSYELLSASEQAVFRQLSVFAGGWTLEAAEAVVRVGADSSVAILDCLSTLVDQSLIRQTEYPDGSGRFRMLETIREYGREQLARSGEADATGRRHAEYMLSIAERTKAAANGPHHRDWLNQLERERANLQAALQFAIGLPDNDLGLRLAIALYGFWYVRGPIGEGADWIDRSLAHDLTAPVSLRSLALYESGELARIRGDYPRAMARGQQSLALATAADDDAGIALATFLLGNIASSEERYDDAVVFLEEALQRYRTLGDSERIAFVLNNLADTLRRLDDLKRATAMLEDALALWESLDSQWGTAVTLVSLGDATLTQGDAPRSRQLYQRSLALVRDIDDKWGVADCLHGLANHARHTGEWARATCLLAGAEQIYNTLGIVSSANEGESRRRMLAEARAAIDEAGFAASWERGQAMTMDQIITYALEPDTADRPSTAPPTSTVLSPREVDVLRLLIDGRSNQEIAEILAISHNTVGTHVTHIFNKLGVTSRTAAATYAIRHELI